MASARARAISVLTAATAACISAVPLLASAHGGGHSAGGFGSGFAHPLMGADHLAAILCVGFWAGQQGGSARWCIPASFVLLMALGTGVGLIGLPLLGVETAILASLVALGVLVATAARFPLAASSIVVAGFALFHGHAHGSELIGSAAQIAGLFSATILLHALGVVFATLADRSSASGALRASGIAVALTGGALLMTAV